MKNKRLKAGQKMPMRDAMELVDDDLPDGAYWAMAHEMAGLEYGEGFDELAVDAIGDGLPEPQQKKRKRSRRNKSRKTVSPKQ